MRSSSFKMYQQGFLRITKKTLVTTLIVLTALTGTGIIYLFNPLGTKEAEAAWYDDNWGYREEVPLTSTNGSAQSNVFVSFSLDTATLITAGKLQSSCQDIRITDIGGNLLPYHVGRTNGCNNASTTIDFLVTSFPDLKSTYYVYYGNPAALSADAGAFSQSQASNYSVGSLGTEAQAPQPVAYWKFDEGTGTTTKDSTTNANNGTLGGTTVPTWQTEDQCISSKCLFYDGSTSKVTGSKAALNVQTVSFWLRPNSIASQGIISLNDGSSRKINTDSSGVISGSGFTSPTYYINGLSTTTPTLVLNKWNYVSITTATGVNSGTAVTIGTDATNFIKGFIDEVKFYDYARSSAQVLADYNAAIAKGGSNLGSNIQNQPAALSNGLVGYWKMDDNVSGDAKSLTDSSGNANTGTTHYGANTTGMDCTIAGKYNYGCTTDGVDDYIDPGTGSTLKPASAITVSAWFKSSVSSGNPRILSANSTGNIGYDLILIGANGRLQFDVAPGGTNYNATATAAYNDNAWHIVVGTWDGSNVRIFVDGSLKATTATTGSTITYGTPHLIIGAQNSTAPSTFFTGSVDEVRVYNSALSPADVSTLYNFAPGPVGYWKMDEGSGTSIADSSSNANTATLSIGGSGTQTAAASAWRTGKYGKGINLDGTDDDVTVANTLSNSQTVSFWLYPSSTTANIFALTSGAYLTSSSGTITATGFTSPVIYVSGVVNGTITANTWNYLTVTTTTGISASAITMGLANGTYLTGKIDEVKIYNYVRTQKQIIEDMNAGHPPPGSPVGTPLGYWDFDEGYGTTANNSGNGGSALNGTLTNMASPATSTSGWTQSGKFSKALLFDPTSSADYIAMPSDVSALKLTSDLTLSAWVNLTSTAAQRDIICKYTGTASTSAYCLYTNSSGKLIMAVVNATGPAIVLTTSTATLSTSTWYHVVGVFSSANSVKLYINGNLDTTNTTSIPTTLQNPTTILDIGGENAGSNTMNGTLDEPKIYAQALTADQVKLDMNRGSSQVLGASSDNSSYQKQAANQEYCVPGDATACAGPIGRWDFEEGSGTAPNDTSGNNFTGSFQNSPTWGAGKYGKGVVLAGSAYVNTSDLNNTIDGVANMTVEAWINPTTLTDFMGIARKGFTTFKRWHLQLSGAGSGTNDDIAFDIGSDDDLSAPTAFTTSNLIATNRWTHVAVTFDGTQSTNATKVKMYINGAQQSLTISGTMPTLTDVNNDAMEIGKSPTTTWNGKLDGVTVYNTTRTAAQIAWDYNKGGPVGYWDMDECQGTTLNDSSGNSSTETLTVGASGTYTSPGTCSTSSAASAWYNGATGKRNYSLAFDGTDDSAITGTATVLNPAAGNYTLSAWVKTSSSNIKQPVLDINNGVNDSSDRMYISVGDGTTAGKPNCEIAVGGSGATFQGPNLINDGNWHLLTCTRTGTGQQGTLYVDGIIVATSSSATGSSIDTDSKLRIAKDLSSNLFTGQIDDVRVYNYALTTTLVKSLYSNGAVNFAPVTGAP